jgi:hypothetical protein
MAGPQSRICNGRWAHFLYRKVAGHRCVLVGLLPCPQADPRNYWHGGASLVVPALCLRIDFLSPSCPLGVPSRPSPGTCDAVCRSYAVGGCPWFVRAVGLPQPVAMCPTQRAFFMPVLRLPRDLSCPTIFAWLAPYRTGNRSAAY